MIERWFYVLALMTFAICPLRPQVSEQQSQVQGLCLRLLQQQSTGLLSRKVGALLAAINRHDPSGFVACVHKLLPDQHGAGDGRKAAGVGGLASLTRVMNMGVGAGGSGNKAEIQYQGGKRNTLCSFVAL